MYRFDYNITEQEYMQFNEYHLLHSPSGKRGLMLTRLIGLLLSMLLIAAFAVAGTEPALFITEIIFLMIFSIVWFIRGKKIAIKNMHKQMSKMKKENGKLYSDKGTMIFDEYGITDSSEDKELKTPYSTVTQLASANDALYIYFSPMMAYIVPLRPLDTNCNVDEFKVFIENKTGLQFN